MQMQKRRNRKAGRRKTGEMQKEGGLYAGKVSIGIQVTLCRLHSG